jgi:hypothetical protein
MDTDYFIPKISINIITGNTIAGTQFKSRLSKTIIDDITWTDRGNLVPKYLVSRKNKYSFYVDLSGGFNNGDVLEGSLNILTNTYTGILFEEIIEDIDYTDNEFEIPASFNTDKVFNIKRSFYSNDINNLTNVKIEGILRYKYEEPVWIINNPTQYYNIDTIIPLTESELSTGSEILLQGSYYNLNNSKFLITNLIDIYSDTNQFIGSKIVINYTGCIIPDFSTIKLSTEKTFRYPRTRRSDEPQHKLKFRWEEFDNDYIFLYDISGQNLTTEVNISYTGELPLWQPNFDCTDLPQVYLNSNPNNDPGRAEVSKYQQTRFDQLEFPIYPLDYVELADSNSCCTSIQPLQAFIGFNYPEEGVVTRTLIIEEVLDITVIFTRKKIQDDFFYDITVNGLNILDYMILNIENSNLDTEFKEIKINSLRAKYNQKATIDTRIVPLSGMKYNVEFKASGEIIVNAYFLDFIQLGFIPGMYVQITGRDITNPKYKSNINNHGFVGKINTVSEKILKLDSLTFTELNEFYVETTWNPDINPIGVNTIPPVGDFNTSLTWIEVTITVLPRVVGKFSISGQSVTEDDRYKQWLDNFGINLNPQDIQIFDDYDINEKGIDWVYYNIKRKEMMLVHQSIFSYIGSYKAIINSINFFGWETLKLNEYYRNIDKTSSIYNSLHAIEIKDIFDPSVEGWNYNFKYPNLFYKKTDLLNLTFEYTDRNGNFISDQTINDVMYKLQKLKYWLKDNVLPLTARILDITIKEFFPSDIVVQHSNNRLIKNRSANNSIVNIDILASAYVLGINTNVGSFRQNALNVHLEFFADTFSEFNLKVITYRQYTEEEISDRIGKSGSTERWCHDWAVSHDDCNLLDSWTRSIKFLWH